MKKKKPQPRREEPARRLPPTLQAPIVMRPEPDEDPWGAEGLTLKQKRFCELYVGECAGNASKAARMAGYRESTAGQTGDENLKKPQIRSYIGRLLAKLKMTPEFIDARLAELAGSSLDNFATIGPNGEVVFSLEAGAKHGAMGQIKEVTEDVLKSEGDTMVIRRKIKVHDPLPALRTILEMQGRLVSRHEVSGKDGSPLVKILVGVDESKV